MASPKVRLFLISGQAHLLQFYLILTLSGHSGRSIIMLEILLLI